MSKYTFFITGGAGFIGSAVTRYIISNTNHKVINIDSLTYAGNLDSLSCVSSSPNYLFENVDISDSKSIKQLFETHQPDIVMHLAAESHVDRSIESPALFLQTNITGTGTLLEQAKMYWEQLSPEKKKNFRFHHISTDEVYGSLGPGELFHENTPYAPSSPYSASKASADHLVRAWHKTYGLPTIITNCSNNYGPYHFPEKLIPHIILNALHNKPIPIYGNGKQIRDWLYVEDHAQALYKVATSGPPGETYNIGASNERQNIDIANSICDLLEELAPEQKTHKKPYHHLITHVKDRPGHDARYAIDSTKIQNDLHWFPTETFESGLRKTVQWYLDNPLWWQRVLSGDYKLKRIA